MWCRASSEMTVPRPWMHRGATCTSLWGVTCLAGRDGEVCGGMEKVRGGGGGGGMCGCGWVWAEHLGVPWGIASVFAAVDLCHMVSEREVWRGACAWGCGGEGWRRRGESTVLPAPGLA